MKNFLGEKQLTGSVILVTEESPKRVLLVHHKKHNVWIQPGGHLEATENPVEGAIRETKEETGIDISFLLEKVTKLDDVCSVLPSPDFLLEETIPDYEDQPQHFHIDCIYVVTIPFQDAKVQEEESHSIGWFEESQLKELPMYENTRMMLKNVLSNN